MIGGERAGNNDVEKCKRRILCEKKKVRHTKAISQNLIRRSRVGGMTSWWWDLVGLAPATALENEEHKKKTLKYVGDGTWEEQGTRSRSCLLPCGLEWDTKSRLKDGGETLVEKR